MEDYSMVLSETYACLIMYYLDLFIPGPIKMASLHVQPFGISFLKTPYSIGEFFHVVGSSFHLVI